MGVAFSPRPSTWRHIFAESLRLVTMARTRAVSLLCACGLAAMLAMVIGSAVLSFVGTPAAASSRLRAGMVMEESQRMPDVAMQFFGGEPVTTTTTPPPLPAADGTYVIGITLFFFASVAANASGFFGPWN